MNKKKITLWIILIVFAQCLSIGSYAVEKQGFHLDEIYSYELANSCSAHRVDNFLNQWHSGEFFSDRLQVDAEKKFDYANVYLNQERDVHPPLFYFLLHTICSFFPDSFSKWYGIVLNIIFFVLTQVVLFLFGTRLFKAEKKAIVPVLLYGFSIGAASCVVFIRMYMILTFWVLLFTYINYLLWQDFTSVKKHISLFCATFFGFMTHYYFVVYAFFISAIFFIGKLIVKEYRQAFFYATVMFGALVTNILYYPAAMKHIFSGYRGEEAFSNFISTGIFENAKGMFSIINKALFANVGEYLLVILLSYIVYVLFKKNLKKIQYDESTYSVCLEISERKKIFQRILIEDLTVLSILVAIVSYIMIISKVAPYITDRYIFCVFPLIMLSLFFFMEKIISWSKEKNKDKLSYFIACILLVITFIGHTTTNVNYLYLDHENKMNLIYQHSQGTAIFIAEQNWKINSDVVLFSNFDYIYPTNLNETVMDEINNKSFEKIMLFVSNDYENSEKVIQQIIEKTRLNHYEYLAHSGYCDVYVCS